MPQHQRSLLGRIARIVGFSLAALVILILAAAGGFAWWLSQTDLKPFVERQASEALGRKVTLATVTVRWSDPLAIDLTGLAIANAPWGSTPEMAKVGRFSALLDVGPLLHGVLRYQRLRMADVTVVLERDPSGAGNWAFGGSAGGLGLVPKHRGQFPTLIDFIGERSLVTYRTRGGNLLRIALDHVDISSPGDDTPVILLARGAYNDVAARLDATTDSYAKLRDRDVPFGTRFTLAGDDTDIAFNGTMMEPLDFEGVHGELSLAARTLNDLLRAMDAGGKANLPLSVTGVLDRGGADWSLRAAKGELQDSAFSGDLALREGKPGAPDDVTLDLDFSTLDADGVASAYGGGKGSLEVDTIPLHPAGLDALNASIDLTTPILALAGRTVRKVALAGRLENGSIALSKLRFALGGGTLSLSGNLKGKDGTGILALDGELVSADIAQIAQDLGATGDEIRGRLDGAASVSLRGKTLGAALEGGDGAAIIALREGDIARSLIEQLSADLRGLFRSEEGRVPLTCMLGVLTVTDGLGILAPLRLESREAIVIGAGKLDLAKDRLDLTVKTERDSTNFFALDIPIRISGPLDRLDVQPLVGSDETWLEQPGAALGSLPQRLRALADANACRR